MMNTRTSLLFFFYSMLAVSPSSGYFVIDNPQRGTQWSNGQNNLASWTKGVLDGIPYFDIELARLSQDGLTYVASSVPASMSSINIYLQDFTPGDDYFLVFLNATAGNMWATSNRFTILGSSGSTTTPPSTTAPPLPPANVKAPTVTVSGSPNPTQPFATTFAGGAANGAWSSRRIGGGGMGMGVEEMVLALLSVLLLGVGSGLMTVW